MEEAIGNAATLERAKNNPNLNPYTQWVDETSTGKIHPETDDLREANLTDNILSCSEINRMQFPENSWRIENLVPLSGLTILAGISGEGKSWISLYFAKCLALGVKVFGQFEVVKSKVLYIDAENPANEIQRRIRLLGMENIDSIHFKIVDSINLNDDDSVAELKELIESEEYDVVFIDTFIAVASGMKPEKAEEIRPFFNRFKEFKNKNVSIIFLDHQRKPANHEGKDPKKEFLFGSQDKVASVETLLMLKKDVDEITIFQRKNRGAVELAPFTVKMEDKVIENGKKVVSFIYQGGAREKIFKIDEGCSFITELLQSGPHTAKEVSMIGKEKGFGERNLNEALKLLSQQKVIDRDRKGRAFKYFLVPDDAADNEVPTSPF